PFHAAGGDPPPLREAIGLSPTDDIPDGYAPFAEWKTILEALPFSIRILIGDTTALIGGNTVLVRGSELQKGYATGEFSEELRAAVSRAIGRKVAIAAEAKRADAAAERETRLSDFLDRARSEGVTVKEQ
ncbi:MAG: hypothetical protein NC202_10005, partial [Roseburia sp.]|nr:hypothetical protein [Roseburia sp.]